MENYYLSIKLMEKYENAMGIKFSNKKILEPFWFILWYDELGEFRSISICVN